MFVLGVDRAVHAFDALDGRKLWTLQRPGDPLTLAQTGVLSAFKDTLLVGQGPRLTGVDPLRGTVRWEVAVGSPRGTNEVERLADLVGPALRVGDTLARARSRPPSAASTPNAARCCGPRTSAAPTRSAAIASSSSAPMRRIASPPGASDNGEVAWTSEALLYRGLSAPLVHRRARLSFGDAEGTLHFLSREKGEALLRLPTDGCAGRRPPVVVGSTLLVVTRKGGLFAFRAP